MKLRKPKPLDFHPIQMETFYWINKFMELQRDHANAENK